MTKQVIGKTYRKEGKDRERLYSVIQCSECGALTYERKANKIEKALESGCRNCQILASPKKAERLQASFRNDERTKHQLYKTWLGMMNRCYDTGHKSYAAYGGRGIEVCLRWLVDFWAFVQDMGEKPEGHTLDRVDNDDIYSPLNCQWSTWSEQMGNRRPFTRGV